MYNSGNRGSQAHTVAHNWAHQLQSKYKKDTIAGSLYYEGKTIYSYGYHFPIAVLHGENDNYCLFTTRGYSNTTAKHISIVRSATSHKTKIYCKNPDEAAKGRHDDNILNFENNAKGYAKSLATCKKPEKYLLPIAQELSELEAYANYFNIDLKTYPLVYVYIKSKEVGSEATEKERKAIEEAKKAKELANEKQNKKELKEFRAFKILTIHARAGFDYLRYNAKEKRIETSQAIQIPVEIARKFFVHIQKANTKGGCVDCKQKLMSYDVKEVNKEFIVIGCHKITIKEVNKIAKKLQW